MCMCKYGETQKWNLLKRLARAIAVILLLVTRCDFGFKQHSRSTVQLAAFSEATQASDERPHHPDVGPFGLLFFYIDRALSAAFRIC